MWDEKYYRFPDLPFWNGESSWDVNQGDHVLWKSVGTGKKGCDSGKVEYFHGTCHGWDRPFKMLGTGPLLGDELIDV